jgi:glutamine synthetase
MMFMDITGINKNVEIPVEDLSLAFEGKIMFDGSSIEGFSRIEESDVFLRPDPSTFAVFPWTNGDHRVARLICDVYTPEGESFAGCPRSVLKRVMKEAQDMGYTMAAGPEMEFFLFLLDPQGRATVQTQDQGSYFDLSPIDRGEDCRSQIVSYLECMGFKMEASHHEVAPGQHELDFAYSDALSTADNLATLRLVVKTVARQHGLHATFMPKPIFGINGSGMHTHQSLFCGDRNCFYDEKGEYQLSDTCLHYMGGLLQHVREFTAITNPLVNSYKRLVPDFEAPVHIAWSQRNRSPLIRVPAPRHQGTRVELRSPDPSCNPYLAFAVMLKAGLDGIRNKIDPGPPVNENIYNMCEDKREDLKIGALPVSLNEAIHCMEESSLVRQTLGDHIFENFLKAKKLEWSMYIQEVHPWELGRYLRIY